MINIPQKFSFTIFSFASLLFAGTLTARAGTIVTETIDGIDWYAYRNDSTSPKISKIDENIVISLKADGYAWAILEPITLNVGEQLELSGTVLFEGTSPNAFYWGIFGQEPNTTNSGASGTSIGEATWNMTGFYWGSNKVYSHFATKKIESNDGSEIDYGSFMNSSLAKEYITSSAAVLSSTAKTGTAYDFSIVLEKTETGYTITVNDEATVSFDSEKSTTVEAFDVIGFKSLVTGTMTLSGLSFAIIPEPSLFGLFAGTLALALAGTRRRRK